MLRSFMKAIAGITGKTYAFQKHQGFTIVELIITITIVGILAGVALPRFVSRETFDTVGFADQTESLMRYTQKVAIAKRRSACVTLTANSITLNYTNAALCDTALALPSDQTNILNAPGTITLSPATGFYFDPLGRPFNTATNTPFAGPLTITISGAPPRTLIIEQETGYVHQ